MQNRMNAIGARAGVSKLIRSTFASSCAASYKMLRARERLIGINSDAALAWRSTGAMGTDTGAEADVFNAGRCRSAVELARRREERY